MSSEDCINMLGGKDFACSVNNIVMRFSILSQSQDSVTVDLVHIPLGYDVA